MSQEIFDPFRREEANENQSGEAPKTEDPENNQSGGFYGPGYFGGEYPEKKPQTGTGFAITGMILGILSLVVCCTYVFAFLVIPLAVLAIIFSAVAPKNERGKMQGMARAGLVCGIFGVVLGVIYWIFIFAYAYLLSIGYIV